MKPVPFKYSNKDLLPGGREYTCERPENVIEVRSLPVWTDGEQCVSCWKMSLKERLSALFFGRVWLALLSDEIQPPACVTACKDYLREIVESTQ